MTLMECLRKGKIIMAKVLRVSTDMDQDKVEAVMQENIADAASKWSVGLNQEKYEKVRGVTAEAAQIKMLDSYGAKYDASDNTFKINIANTGTYEDYVNAIEEEDKEVYFVPNGVVIPLSDTDFEYDGNYANSLVPLENLANFLEEAYKKNINVASFIAVSNL